MSQYFSKEFKAIFYRLSIAGIIMLVGIPLGAVTYFYTLTTPSFMELRNFQGQIEHAADQDVTIVAGSHRFLLKKEEIKNWIETYTRAYTRQKDLRFSNALHHYVINLAKQVNKDPVDARFVFENGVTQEFTPAQPGEELNPDDATRELTQGLLDRKPEITLSVRRAEPTITLEKINKLGITSRLAIGESNFVGSSGARVQNIRVAAKRYNGLIINPGDNFSFNQILGEVDAAAGYVPEKVIKNHKLEYEYGGGICQVSTTLFRAVAYAGLPVLERKNHAFPVAYYSPQGFDATIYPGVSDFRFVNDTPGHLLLQTKIVGTHITFEIYGTNDGRKVALEGPIQYDEKPDGSMKALLTRTILYPNGINKADKFTSIYRSPALYPLEKNPYE
ncbi:VanW family protein [Candidatus Parcubacteria bacterium]|nr:VanW family protein [Candidatus Parcubacteria bacterium]